MTRKARIIVCDDEAAMRDLLAEILTEDGHDVTQASDGAALRRLVPQVWPDLVLCDVKMPGEDGLSLTRWLRAESRCGVLLLTGMGSAHDRVAGLEAGADDHVAKPFDPADLCARIRAVLWRAAAPVTDIRARIRVGRCIVDAGRRALLDESGAEVRLGPVEFDLLCTFLRHPGRVLTRDRLSGRATGQDPFDRSLDIRIARLRRMIEIDPARPTVLRTLHGQGFMLVPEGG